MAFRHALCAIVLSCVTVTSAAAQVQGGVDEVVRELGFALELPVSKSVAATGTLLHVAKIRLPESEFVALTESLPGTERVINQAANVLAADLPKDMASVPAAYDKLALPRDQIGRHRNFILDYVRKNGGKKAVASLQKAWAE
ncbi:MAG: hypothetical protein RLY56_612 [Pseudomonadota bacterium]|jgi:hypothetical protein